MREALLIIITFIFVEEIWCECSSSSDQSHVTDYVIVPEANYDRNYSSINRDGRRPLGFAKAIWYYNQPNLNPCVKINGTDTRRLEIMFETHPEARLCVRDQTSLQACSDAATGSLRRCIKPPGNDVYLEFFCDSQCGEADVQFWYRLVLGVQAVDDPEDHWCEGRNTNEYPESLRKLPDDYPIQQETTTPSSAVDSSASKFWLFCCVVFFMRKFV